jgi:hypothetical protein
MATKASMTALVANENEKLAINIKYKMMLAIFLVPTLWAAFAPTKKPTRAPIEFIAKAVP